MAFYLSTFAAVRALVCSVQLLLPPLRCMTHRHTVERKKETEWQCRFQSINNKRMHITKRNGSFICSTSECTISRCSLCTIDGIIKCSACGGAAFQNTKMMKNKTAFVGVFRFDYEKKPPNALQHDRHKGKQKRNAGNGSSNEAWIAMHDVSNSSPSAN